MKNELKKWLISCETDVEGAIKRFSNDESLYEMYLKMFPEEPTMNSLGNAVMEKKWDDAFTFVHSLKGLAGNLGFVPLYYATAELVWILRDKRIDEITKAYSEVKECYNKVIVAITNGMKAIQ